MGIGEPQKKPQSRRKKVSASREKRLRRHRRRKGSKCKV